MKASIIALVGAAAAVSAHSNGTVPWTTSTVYSTRTSTISECAETVTNCPYRTHPVTTEIVDVYTTYCPVAASESSAAAVTPTPSASVPAGPMTTSTVYSTETLTISSCAPEVTNCPYTTKPITTIKTHAVSTTVCPVTTETPTSLPGGVVSTPASLPGGVETSSPVSPPSGSSAPVSPPSSPSKPAPILSTITISTCVPTTYTSVITVTSTSAAGGASSTGGVIPPPHKGNSTSPIPFTGGASSQKAAGLLMAVGLAAALL